MVCVCGGGGGGGDFPPLPWLCKSTLTPAGTPSQATRKRSYVMRSCVFVWEAICINVKNAHCIAASTLLETEIRRWCVVVHVAEVKTNPHNNNKTKQKKGGGGGGVKDPRWHR